MMPPTALEQSRTNENKALILTIYNNMKMGLASLTSQARFEYPLWSEENFCVSRPGRDEMLAETWRAASLPVPSGIAMWWRCGIT
jgi:hypothetical protein